MTSEDPGSNPVATSPDGARPLRILMLEDVATDGELMERALRKGGVAFTAKRVDARAAFVEALEAFRPDVVLSDYTLPDFNGREALEHVRRVHPEIPVVMVTGTLGEEQAIELLKAGAKEYVLKNNLLRLPSAVERAIAVERGIRARKASEREVRQAALYARSLIEASLDPLVMIGEQGKITDANKAAEEASGKSRQEMIGTDFAQYVTEPDRARAAYEQALLVGSVKDLPLVLRHTSGRLMDVIYNASLYYDETGAVAGVAAAARDITEMKKLQGARDRLALIVETAEDGIVGASPDGTITSWNNGAVRLFGYTVAEAIGQRVTMLAPPDEESEFVDLIADIRKAGSVRRYETQRRRKDGALLDVSVSLSPITDSVGVLVGMSVIYRDITERKQADARLQESQKRYRQLFEFSRDAIVSIAPPSWRVVSANRAALEMFEAASVEALKDVSPWQISPATQPGGKPSSEQSVEMIDRAMRDGSHLFEWEHHRKDGTLFLTEVLLTRVKSNGETFLYAAIRDITERKRTERALGAQMTILATEHELSPDGILVVDEAGHILSVNRRFGEIFGIPPEQLAAKQDVPVLQTVVSQMADEAGFLARVQYLYAHPEESSRETLLLKDGRVIDRHTAPMRNVGYIGRVWYFRDITERIAAARQLERVNHTLRTLSRANEIVVRAKSEDELLREMCGAIVETGKYRMAWVGRVERDAAKSVTPIATSGADGEYLAKIKITWADEPHGQGPTGRAIRSGEPAVSQNWGLDSKTAPWRKEAESSGFAASIALPLKDAGGVFAVLNIYAAQPDAFDAAALKLLRDLADDLSFGIRALRERDKGERAEQRWRNSLESTVGAIASTVELRDPYTAGHQERVGKLAVGIARGLHLSEDRIHGLYLAGVIHDVGKINVPAEILSKPTKLSKVEYQLIQGHPEAGYEIVKAVDFPWPIAEMVRQHHERLDGSGYPRGLKGEEILLEARILAVADVVESMMSHRPYRPARGLDAALAEIEQGKGSRYDAAVVEACIALLRKGDFKFE